MTLTPYCTVEDVKDISRVTHKKIGLDKATQPEKLDEILSKWILEATALINDYTNNPLTSEEYTAQETKYYVYRNVASRIVANMCALAAAYKSHSVVKINDWTIGTIPSEIFPLKIKQELDNYKSESTGNSLGFGILTVKGRGIFNENRDKIG
ncbi:hypothetical protein PXD04_10380 [Methanosphaera sp. ISO3-F5]|uniref:hypothetical protein n=1 Tax=Methanosphaera sp. ISO3-F5 TaxID=1452353 RepID=UPI002B25CED1|nr:hypothetical protein [Methanosphaera sp. ISO3-F5]WQH64097.1 hypothetical protein PXD04_10380 [Methanosphaera sp. ISO3-F5]